MSKLPTLFLLSQLSMGGSERKTVRIVNALRGRGENVHLAYLNAPETLLPEIDPSVPIVHLDRKGKFSWQALTRLRDYIDAHEIDRIICINLYPLLYSSLLRILMWNKMPSIMVSVNTTYFLDPKEERSMAIYKPLLHLSDGIIFGCNYQRAIWLEKYGLPTNKCSFIYNGVEANFYSLANSNQEAVCSLLSELGLTESDFVIGTVGQMRPEKQQSDLIWAVKRLADHGIACTALIVGGGPEEKNLRSLASQLGVNSRVFFLGELKDVRPALMAMDLFVLPSVAVETFSNAALEAMAMGKPVVLSDIGGAREMVYEGQNGFLFPPGNVDKLVDILTLLAQETAPLSDMGRLARELIEKQFSFSRMVSSYEALLPMKI